MQSIYNCIRVIPLPWAECADYQWGLAIPAGISLGFGVWRRRGWEGCWTECGEAHLRPWQSQGQSGSRVRSEPGNQTQAESLLGYPEGGTRVACGQAARSAGLEKRVALWSDFIGQRALFPSRNAAGPRTALTDV